MKFFQQIVNDPAQAIKDEIAAATGHIDELTAQLADIEQKLGEAHNKTKRSFAEGAVDNGAIAAVSVEALEDKRQGIHKRLAEVQRSRKLAEQRFAALQEAEAVAGTKVSDKDVSAFEVCAGELRWRNGLLEQLWHINYLGPTGAVERTIEEWQLVPVSEEPAIAGHIRCRSRQPV